MNLNENIQRIKEVMGVVYETTTNSYREFYDEEDTNRFEKILNKSMKKYDWWKDIEIHSMYYDIRIKLLKISATISVDLEWAANQWMSLYDTKKFNENARLVISEIVNSKLGYELRDDISDIFEFTFGKQVITLSLNSFYLKFVSTEDIQESVEQKTKKDLAPLIKESLNGFIERNKHIVCGIEVTAPWNREVVDRPHEYYKVLVTFVGGYGSKYFPVTQKVRDDYDSLIDEIWEHIYNYFGEFVDIFSKKVPQCDEMKKYEESEGVGAYAAPAFEMKPDHVHFKRQFR